jgi:hypothetical protein
MRGKRGVQFRCKWAIDIDMDVSSNPLEQSQGNGARHLQLAKDA